MTFGRNIQNTLQCESKNPTLRFSEIFSQTVGNFQSIFTHLLYDHFYTILQFFYSNISNFDKVMPY